MATSIKKLPDNEQVLSGNGACGGCPATMALRIVGKALGPNAIMLLTPACAVASMGMTPRLGYNWPCINITFASAGSSASGISHALEIMKEKGRLQGELPTVFSWVGDGGTYDIGFQALSGRRAMKISFTSAITMKPTATPACSAAGYPRQLYHHHPTGKSQPKEHGLIDAEHNIHLCGNCHCSYPVICTTRW